MSRRYKIIILAISLLGLAVVARQIVAEQHRAPETSTNVNSVLAIRGFRHDQLEVATGEIGSYEVDTGEEFKVTWKVENATENGQLLYQGPAGVGSGLIPVPLVTDASRSSAPFLTFTPKKPGTAQFLLTVTGPGPDGIYTLTSTLTVHIK